LYQLKKEKALPILNLGSQYAANKFDVTLQFLQKLEIYGEKNANFFAKFTLLIQSQRGLDQISGT
jgi:hypothetical protein